MASLCEVKQYVAHWFQLGKKIYIRNGDFSLLPSQIFQGLNYTAEFDRCWRLISSDLSGDCYLEDTTQTINELLTPQWELVGCARCNMPVPLKVAGIPPTGCPCANLPHWPNNLLPAPITRATVDLKLLDIQHRLDQNL